MTATTVVLTYKYRRLVSYILSSLYPPHLTHPQAKSDIPGVVFSYPDTDSNNNNTTSTNNATPSPTPSQSPSPSSTSTPSLNNATPPPTPTPTPTATPTATPGVPLPTDVPPTLSNGLQLSLQAYDPYSGIATFFASAPGPGFYFIHVAGTRAPRQGEDPSQRVAFTDLYGNNAQETTELVQCYVPSLLETGAAAAVARGAIVGAGLALVGTTMGAAASVVGVAPGAGVGVSGAAAVGMVNALQVLGMTATLMPDNLSPQPREIAVVRGVVGWG